ncbi:MAG TPA: two-component system response regulator [Methylophilaceae bacterium]|nr:two-component system response regulator [Methylophilaceae bacterium]
MKIASTFDDATILIIDDQTTSRTILSQVVKSIHPKIHVVEKTNPENALAWATEHTADLILVDYVMPEMNGIEFVRMIKTIAAYQFVPTIMITIKKDTETRNAALNVGVTDFLSKPIDVQECTARCKNLLTMRQQHLTLETRSNILESLVQAATAEIKAREKETLMRLARIGEYKDYETSRHLVRMALYARVLAEALGFSEEDAETIELAAPLHDIGKVGIPDHILLKTGPLDENELRIMRKHPAIGYQVLQDSPSKYLQKGAEIAMGHHERYDGKGYPNGLAGKKIPIAARIVAIADVFDALTSVRPYKEAWSIDSAIQYIEEEGGKHFDPDVVKILSKVRPRLEKIYAEYSN